MRATSSLSFRPTVLALEDRTVPATLVELQAILHTAPKPSADAPTQTAVSAPAAAPPTVHTSARRF